MLEPDVITPEAIDVLPTLKLTGISVKDFLGRDVYRGDFIIYCRTVQYSAHLRVAKVLDIKTTGLKVAVPDPGRLTWNSKLAKFVIENQFYKTTISSKDILKIVPGEVRKKDMDILDKIK